MSLAKSAQIIGFTLDQTVLVNANAEPCHFITFDADLVNKVLPGINDGPVAAGIPAMRLAFAPELSSLAQITANTFDSEAQVGNSQAPEVFSVNLSSNAKADGTPPWSIAIARWTNVFNPVIGRWVNFRGNTNSIPAQSQPITGAIAAEIQSTLVTTEQIDSAGYDALQAFNLSQATSGEIQDLAQDVQSLSDEVDALQAGGPTPVVSVTDQDYVLTNGDQAVVLVSATADRVFTGSGGQSGLRQRIKNSSDFLLTFVPTGGALINADSSLTLGQGEDVEIEHDGTNWHIVNKNEVLIEVVNPSANSTIELFNEFNNNKFKAYKLVIRGLVPNTDNSLLYVRTSSDGSTFDSGASDYGFSGNMARSSSNIVGVDPQINVILSNGISNVASEGGISGVIEIFNPQSGLETQFRNRMVFADDALSYPIDVTSSGSRNDTSALRGIQLSGNLADWDSGQVLFYGVLK